MAYAALVEKTVPLSRRRFFAVLMDFGGIAKLAPDQVDKLECVGEGIGAVRTVHLTGVPTPVVERLEVAYDERVFAYSMIDPGMMPFEHYLAVVELADAPNGGCQVRWGSNWVAKGLPEAAVRQMVTGLYEQLIAGVVAAG